MAMSRFDAWAAAAGGREALDEAMRRRVTIQVSILDAFTMHGLIDLALKHPSVGRPTRDIGEAILRTLQEHFRAAGLPEPSQGWRGTVPIDGLGSPLKG